MGRKQDPQPQPQPDPQAEQLAALVDRVTALAERVDKIAAVVASNTGIRV